MSIGILVGAANTRATGQEMPLPSATVVAGDSATSRRAITNTMQAQVMYGQCHQRGNRVSKLRGVGRGRESHRSPGDRGQPLQRRSQSIQHGLLNAPIIRREQSVRLDVGR